MDSDPRTVGEEAVGTNFNPSEMNQVDELKALFAKAYDIVDGAAALNDLDNELKTMAKNQVILAQMSCVKIVTRNS